jgi:hypothetical protein
MRESQHEPTIEIGKSKEALNFSEFGWGWTVTDDLNIGCINMQTIPINNVT